MLGKELTRLIICNSVVCQDITIIFPSNVLDWLWVLIRPVPEVSLLLLHTIGTGLLAI